MTKAKSDKLLKSIAGLREYIVGRMEKSPEDQKFFVGLLEVTAEMVSAVEEQEVKILRLQRDIGHSDAFVDPRDSGPHRMT